MQQVSDCDIVLAHDDDLVMVNGIGHDTVSVLLNRSYVGPLKLGIVGSYWNPSNR